MSGKKNEQITVEAVEVGCMVGFSVVRGEGMVTDIRLCSMLAHRKESSAVLYKATQSARNQ